MLMYVGHLHLAMNLDGAFWLNQGLGLSWKIWNGGSPVITMADEILVKFGWFGVPL
jgi:hypothetical protein